MLAAGSSVAVFYLWEVVTIPEVISSNFQHYLSFLIPLVCLAASSSLFALAGMFVRDRRIAYCAAVVGAGVPYFFARPSLPTLAVLAISLICIVFAVHKIRQEFLLSVGFSVSKTVKSGLALYFTVASLTLTLFYVHALNDKSALSALLPQPAFDFTLQYFFNSPFARSLTGLPQVRQDITANEFLDVLISQQLKSQGLESVNVPASERTHLREVERRQIARQYGITLKGNERMLNVFYDVVAQRAVDLLGPYRRYLPLLSGIAFFFAFKALTVAAYLISLLIIFLLIRIFLFVKILRRTTEHIQVERITF
ncbi:MAG: hypothetical protein HY221_01195 [Candidatus Sungbacteria bacterium]|uniref:Uncharacterized protein n=1 Tax=Candidatus Sungiibacteriota bacterium TaxID=2750080 RepID=A0A932R1F2_9BACT|nr:hypothetical protein [Candidatus Sungbacteria bacterium]